jgi:hypothetical protein
MASYLKNINHIVELMLENRAVNQTSVFPIKIRTTNPLLAMTSMG